MATSDEVRPSIMILPRADFRTFRGTKGSHQWVCSKGFVRTWNKFRFKICFSIQGCLRFWGVSRNSCNLSRWHNAWTNLDRLTYIFTWFIYDFDIFTCSATIYTIVNQQVLWIKFMFWGLVYPVDFLVFYTIKHDFILYSLWFKEWTYNRGQHLRLLRLIECVFLGIR